jgi:hypothetical protein
MKAGAPSPFALIVLAVLSIGGGLVGAAQMVGAAQLHLDNTLEPAYEYLHHA